ncbi:MAG TPA: LysR family transcriptional regulator [Candidatus Borkfalkia stercoripullorum]|nr:LysR family transcriptional regulator [Candidatus Borkfalkia stercoripullorum]
MVNLELYRVFYTVAKCGSLTRAADELFISQPAVSQAIKQLEGQLGTPLFNRTHRGMELSDRGGKQIFDIVARALAELDEAENKLKEINSTATGTIRISASDTIFSYVVIDKIAEYHEKFPDVKINLINCITTETLDLLKNNKCDIAFLNLPVDDKDINLTSVIMPLHDTFVANKNYAALAEDVQPLKSMHDYPLLMLDQNTVTRKAIINFSHSIGVHLHPEVECGSLELMIQLAKNGVGIACVPKEYVRRELNDDKTLFEIRTEPALPARSIGIAFPKNQPISYATKEFFKLFNKE